MGFLLLVLAKDSFRMRLLRISRLLLGFAWIVSSAASKSTLVWARTKRAATASDPSTSTAPTATEQTVYMNSSDFYCPAVNGLTWTLFREKCYYVGKRILLLDLKAIIALLCPGRLQRNFTGGLQKAL